MCVKGLLLVLRHSSKSCKLGNLQQEPEKSGVVISGGLLAMFSHGERNPIVDEQREP